MIKTFCDLCGEELHEDFKHQIDQKIKTVLKSPEHVCGRCADNSHCVDIKALLARAISTPTEFAKYLIPYDGTGERSTECLG